MGRRVAIGVLVVALLTVGVLAITHKGKPSNIARPSGQTVPARLRKLTAVQLSALASLAKVVDESTRDSRARFKLTYSSYGVTGSTSQTVVEQMPPDRLFKTRTSEVVVKGKKTYYCTTTQDGSCHITHSAAASPLGHLMAVYSAAYYVTSIETLRKLIKTGVAYHFSSSKKTFAGQPSQCFSWGYLYSAVNFCVTKTGVLTYFTISGLTASRDDPTLTLSIRLTRYSSTVTAADFALPKEAKL